MPDRIRAEGSTVRALGPSATSRSCARHLRSLRRRRRLASIAGNGDACSGPSQPKRRNASASTIPATSTPRSRSGSGAARRTGPRTTRRSRGLAELGRADSRSAPRPRDRPGGRSRTFRRSGESRLRIRRRRAGPCERARRADVSPPAREISASSSQNRRYGSAQVQPFVRVGLAPGRMQDDQGRIAYTRARPFETSRLRATRSGCPPSLAQLSETGEVRGESSR